MLKYTKEENRQLQFFINQLRPGFYGGYALNNFRQRSDEIKLSFNELPLYYQDNSIETIKLRYIANYALNDTAYLLGLGPRKISYEISYKAVMSQEIKKVICCWPLVNNLHFPIQKLEFYFFQYVVLAARFFLDSEKGDLVFLKENAKEFLTGFFENKKNRQFQHWLQRNQAANMSEIMQFIHLLSNENLRQLMLLVTQQHDFFENFFQIVQQLNVKHVPEKLLRMRADYSNQTHALNNSNRYVVDWSRMDLKSLSDAYQGMPLSRAGCNQLTYTTVVETLLQELPSCDQPLLIISLGCGTGECEKIILERWSMTPHRDLRIFAVDVNPQFIRQAQADFFGNHQIHFETMDIFQNDDLVQRGKRYFLDQDGVERRVVLLAVTGVLGDFSCKSTCQAVRFLHVIHDYVDYTLLASFTPLLVSKKMAKQIGYEVRVKPISWPSELHIECDTLPAVFFMVRHQTPEEHHAYIMKQSYKHSLDTITLDLSVYASPFAYLLWFKRNHPQAWENYQVLDLAWSKIRSAEMHGCKILLKSMPNLKKILVSHAEPWLTDLLNDSELKTKVRCRLDRHGAANELPFFSRSFLKRAAMVSNIGFSFEKPVAEEIATMAVKMLS
ncbi:MAG: hypothetical protein A3F10_02495 [Coxiella sp. RIFCSPHIGHO2_12_FULL_42_15]|nr:MAG: hypothetical protein A3F10_02495 [Coxiella sp. RIFCSPHIGHO2_12_FULL_42_15]